MVVRKFFLNLSKAEQKKRFLERLEEPEKNWKFSISDVLERQHWNEYMRAYQEMIQNTSTKHAPWYVVPADHKWFARLVVAEALIDTLEELRPAFPKPDAERRKDVKKAKAALLHEEMSAEAMVNRAFSPRNPKGQLCHAEGHQRVSKGKACEFPAEVVMSGGPSGLATAIAASLKGFRTVVVDARKPPSTRPAAKDFSRTARQR